MKTIKFIVALSIVVFNYGVLTNTENPFLGWLIVLISVIILFLMYGD